MRGGISTWICLASLAAGGCTTAPQTAEFKVRAIPDAAAKLGAGTGLLADAAGQLAIGNVGLALEGFRKALREQPNSPEAYAGIAKCYEAMGRYDLARTNYEAALALTPQSPQLLTAVAVTLDAQGDPQAAAVARQDAAAARAPDVPLPQVRGESNAAVSVASSITVQLPQARPATVVMAKSGIAVDLAVPKPLAVEDPVAATRLPRPRADQAAPVALDSSAVQAALSWSAELARSLGSYLNPALSLTALQAVPKAAPAEALPQPKSGRLASVTLNPGGSLYKLASSVGGLRALAAGLGFSLEADIAPRYDTKLAKPADAAPGPYLERLSPGEVALVTDGRPAWRAQLIAQTRTSTTVRWVPIMTAEARPNIRILNAAQRQGLAAQTRSVLLDRGWRKIEVATAADSRDSSLVLYPASRRTLGRSLAAQFGFPAQLRSDVIVLTVLLGRDAARPVAFAKRG